jgi:hypothetical protein
VAHDLDGTIGSVREAERGANGSVQHHWPVRQAYASLGSTLASITRVRVVTFASGKKRLVLGDVAFQCGVHRGMVVGR